MLKYTDELGSTFHPNSRCILQTARRHAPENNNLHNEGIKNLKYSILPECIERCLPYSLVGQNRGGGRGRRVILDG